MSRYDGVPFSSEDFHQPACEIQNYNNPEQVGKLYLCLIHFTLLQVRNCYLVYLNDLDGGKEYVREKIAGYFNDVVDMGVRGFR